MAINMFLIHNISKNDAFWINVNFRGIFSEPIRSKIGNSRKRNYLPWKSYFGKTKVIFVFSGPIYIRKVKQDPVYRTHPKICYPVIISKASTSGRTTYNWIPGVSYPFYFTIFKFRHSPYIIIQIQKKIDIFQKKSPAPLCRANL